EGRRKALLEQRRDRAALPQRDPELALRRAPHEARELHVRRLIEPEVGPKLRALLGARLLSDHEGDWVAGKVEERERDERDDRHDDERLNDAAKNESEQRRKESGMPLVAACGRGPTDDAETPPERQCARRRPSDLRPCMRPTPRRRSAASSRNPC